ncbi:hypothetical protein [Cytobacillus oceanisediminis]|nr:hypothetical protein [Cytobacillus oceanisediminis]
MRFNGWISQGIGLVFFVERNYVTKNRFLFSRSLEQVFISVIADII